MTGGDEQRSTAVLKLWAQEASARAAACKMQAAKAAESAAERKDRAKRIIDRMTVQNPEYAAPPRAASGTAVRPRAAIVASDHHWGAPDRPRGPLVPEPRTEPEAAVISGLEEYLRDMAIVEERDRMASQLQDKVIQRVFAAGLTLQGAAGLTTQPEVRRRIEAATDELDEVIRVIRDSVFNLPGSSVRREPGGG